MGRQINEKQEAEYYCPEYQYGLLEIVIIHKNKTIYIIFFLIEKNDNSLALSKYEDDDKIYQSRRKLFKIKLMKTHEVNVPILMKKYNKTIKTFTISRNMLYECNFLECTSYIIIKSLKLT